MDLTNLSSNWKNLQSTIQNDASKPTKPKDEKKLSAKVKHSVKPPVKTHNKSKIQKPGGEQTATKAGAPSSASLALLAEEHDIPIADLAQAYGSSASLTEYDDRENEGLSTINEIGTYLAVDCEMVGVGEEDRSVLARVSIVNFRGEQVYDSFVQPGEFVTNWRTQYSGIRPSSMAQARPIEAVQQEVAELLKDKVMIGHDLKNDTRALSLKHPYRMVRDTAKLEHFRKLAGTRHPSLKKLARQILNVDIQRGEHSSVEDARACMLLFRRHKAIFEQEHSQRFQQKESVTKSKGKYKKPRGRKT